jgi:cyclopropane fatty-acyl-phospholipid synthase-like methyltransferase
MSYDKTYSETDYVFGIKPEKTLIDFVSIIPKTKPVLDIGAGQGRNSIFLANESFLVDAIDPSKVAINTLSQTAIKEKYAITTQQVDFKNFNPESKYSAILVFGLIQILDWKSISILLDKIENWLAKDGFIFITGFSVNDASFSKYKKNWTSLGKNSFTDNHGNFRTFLEPNEILTLFNNYTIVHHWEGLGSKHRHGNSPEEQHALIELVIQKK